MSSIIIDINQQENIFNAYEILQWKSKGVEGH